jgi:hypothetical protein
MARAAARDNWAVTYIETLGWSPFPKTARVIDDTTVVRMRNIIPFAGKAMCRPSRAINWAATNMGKLRKEINSSDIVLAFDPLWNGFMDSGNTKLIYDCLDAYEFQPQYSRTMSAKALKKSELRIATAAHQLFTSSPLLSSKKASDWGRADVQTARGAIEPWANQAECEHRAKSLTGITKKRALFVSALDEYKIDLPSLARMARQNCDWEFVVYGQPVFGWSSNLNLFLSMPNVTYRGRASIAQVAADPIGYDLGIVCLSRSEYSRYSFPLKTWDYLSLGIPVFAINAPSLEGIDGVKSMSPTGDARLADYDFSRHNFRRYIETAFANTSEQRWKLVSGS